MTTEAAHAALSSFRRAVHEAERLGYGSISLLDQARADCAARHEWRAMKLKARI